MLTLEKLAIYARFGGDIDGWARMAGEAERRAISGADWALIDELRMGLAALASGHASAGFRAGLERKLAASLADDGVRAALQALD